MSETDKYVEAYRAVVGCYLDASLFSYDAPVEGAAYLREHFVTREFHTESKNSLHKLVRGLCDQRMTLAAERDRLRAALEGIKQIVHRRELPITHQVYDAVESALNPENV